MAVSEVADLYIILRAMTDPFKKSMAEAGITGDKAATGITGSMQKILPVSKDIIAGFAVAAVASVKWATDFQTAYTKLWTAAGASKQAVLDNRDAMLALGTQTGFTGTQIAEALYHPISTGLDLAKSLDVVRYAAEEARISGANLDDTTYTLTSVLKAFSSQNLDAGQTMSLLNSIVGQGDTTFQDFNASIKSWAPTAAAMKIDIQSMGAGLAYLTDRGNSAEEASTKLTMGLTMMATPSAQASKLLIGLGVASDKVKASSSAMTEILQKTHVTQNELATDLQKPDGLYVALNHLQTAMDQAGIKGTEADSVFSKLFGGGRSDKGIMSLMQDLGGLKQKYADIGQGANMGTFNKAFADASNTLHAQLETLKAAAVNLGIKIGEALIPPLTKFIGWIMEGAKWLSQHKVALAALAGVITALMVPAIVAATIAVYNFTVAAGPWLLLAAAIGAAAYEIYTHWSTIWAWLKGAWKWIETESERLAKWIGKVWDEAMAGVKGTWDAIIKYLSGIWQDITNIWNQTGGKFVTYVAHVWDQVSGPFVDEWNHIVDDLSSIWDSLVTIWNQTLGRLVTLISNVFDTMWNGVIKPYMKVIEVGIKFTLSLIATIFKVYWDLIQMIVKLVWDLIVIIIKVAWDTVVGIVEFALNYIWGVMKAFWDMIQGGVKTAWDLITGVINTALDFLKDLFKLFADLLTGKWSKLWDDLKKIATDLWHNLWLTIKNTVVDVVETLYKMGKDIVGGLINGIEDMVKSAVQAIKDVWNGMYGFFKDVGHWLYQAGKDLIQGLINGVSDMVSSATNAIGNLADSVWQSAKHGFGLWSPSHIAYGHGQMIVQGLINGINSMQGAASDSMLNLASHVNAGFTVMGAGTTGTSPFSRSGIPGGVNGQPNVIVNVAVSGTDLRNAVQTQMLQLGARYSTSYTPYRR